MRRADRLFQIIQTLRRSHRPVTAARLAEELEVSRRTVYRDIADLIGQRVPIEGAAGFGYRLGAGYDMPPLMLTPDEIEAVVLGAQLVARFNDPALADAARDVVAKIATAVPERLRPHIVEPSVVAKPADDSRPGGADKRALRTAIRDGRKLRLLYRSETGDETQRIVWPVVLGYTEARCILIAWCETRQDFRHFRTDRILEAQVLAASCGLPRRELRRRWERWREAERERLGYGG